MGNGTYFYGSPENPKNAYSVIHTVVIYNNIIIVKCSAVVKNSQDLKLKQSGVWSALKKQVEKQKSTNCDSIKSDGSQVGPEGDLQYIKGNYRRYK